MTKGGRNYLPPLAGNRYTLLKNTKLKKYILPTPPPLAGNRYTADKKVRRHFWLWILVSQKCETNDAPAGIISLLAGNEKAR